MTGAPQLHREALPGRGPCAFLLHGMLSSRLQWHPNLPALSRHLRPVAFDLWGHGRSPAPLDDAAYTVPAMVAQLERAREALGEQRLVLVGQSFGAGLALHYALRHPERVLAVVFTNSSSALADPDDARLRATQQRMIEAIEAGGAQAVRELPMHPRGGKRLPPGLKPALIAAADAVHPQAVLRLARVTAPALSVARELARLACPVLLVNGRHEAPFQRWRDLAARAIPRGEVADLDAGHAVNLEAPAAFDAAVIDFVQRHAAEAGPPSPSQRPRSTPHHE